MESSSPFVFIGRRWRMGYCLASKPERLKLMVIRNDSGFQGSLTSADEEQVVAGLNRRYLEGGEWIGLVDRGKGKRPSTPFEPVSPMSNASIHRDFADLTNGPTEQFIQFADRWGLLGRREWYPWESMAQQACLEPIRLWRCHAAKMAVLVGTWDAIQSKTLARLRKYLAVDDEPFPMWRCRIEDGDKKDNPGSTLHPLPTGVHQIVRYWESKGVRRDPFLLASAMVQEEVNRELQEGLRLFAWVFGSPNGAIQIRPIDLLGVLYAQFAAEIAGPFGMRQCPVCGAPMPNKAPQAICCGDPCYQTYRRRQIKEGTWNPRKYKTKQVQMN